MKGYVENIEKVAIENDNFRKVLYTAKNCQLVVMALQPGEDIGEEIHDLDQFLRVEAGNGKAILNDVEYTIEDGSAIIVPAGVKHNIVNSSADTVMKLYTLYAPPEHMDHVVRATKEEAMTNEEHFDGSTTE